MESPKIKATIKLLSIPCGKAAVGGTTPQLPIGFKKSTAIAGAVAQKGFKPMVFCKEFNKLTETENGYMNAKLIIYKDDSYRIITRRPSVTNLLKNELGLAEFKGPDYIVSMEQIISIAKKKLDDSTCASLDGMINCVIGTIKSIKSMKLIIK